MPRWSTSVRPLVAGSLGLAIAVGGSAVMAAPAVAVSAHATSSGAATATPNYPDDITVGPDGDLWYAESGGNKIGRMTTAGALTEFPVPTADSSPTGITVGPDGNLWFTESDADQIGVITPSGHVTEYAVPTGASSPFGITAGPDGNLWFTESATDQIGRITTSGVVTEYPVPTHNTELRGITLGPDGNLWFTEYLSGLIGRITPDGDVTEYPLPTTYSNPDEIVAGPDGRLWLTEEDAAQIAAVTTTGAVTEYPTPSQHSDPVDIIAAAGELWFTEYGADQIGRMSTNGNTAEYVIPTVGSGPIGITAKANGTGTDVWFTESDANQVGRLAATGGITEFPASPIVVRQSGSFAGTTVRPYHDGYEDYATLKAISNVTTTGTMEIRNSHGTVVWTHKLAAAKSWTVQWHGTKTSGARVANGTYSARITLLASGAKQVVATHSLKVLASQVATPKLSLSATSVYPVKDGYRDHVTLHVTASLPATGKIVVMAHGHTYWSHTVHRARTWTVSWSGRTAAGKMLGSGKYTVTADLRGGEGKSRSHSTHVTVSDRKLVWVSFSDTMPAQDAFDLQAQGTYRHDPGDAGGIELEGDPATQQPDQSDFSRELPHTVGHYASLRVSSCTGAAGANDPTIYLNYTKLDSVRSIIGAQPEVHLGDVAHRCYEAPSAPTAAVSGDRVSWEIASLDFYKASTWHLHSFKITGKRGVLR